MSFRDRTKRSLFVEREKVNPTDSSFALYVFLEEGRADAVHIG